MLCRTARRELQLRSDDRLSFERELALGVHLETCSACRAFEATLERIDESLARWPEPASERIDLDAAWSAIRTRIEPAPMETPAAAPPARGTWIAAASIVSALVVGALAWRAFDAHRSAADSRTIAPRIVESGVTTPPALPTGEAPNHVAPTESVVASAEPIDPQRVIAAREFLLAALTSVEPRPRPDASIREVREFAMAVDEELRAGGSWPWRRMAERLLREEPAEVADIAARYLGIGADRLTVTALASALDRVECCEAVALALRDAGAATHPAIAAALRDPSRFAAASSAVAVLSASERAQVFDVALRGLPVQDRAANDIDALIVALADTGPEALPALLEACAREDLSTARLAEVLRARAWAADELVAAAWRARRSATGELTLQLAAQVAGLASLDALEDQIVRSGLRAAALHAMSSVGGSEAFVRIASLHSAGYVDFDSVDRALHALTDTDPLATRAAVLSGIEESLVRGDPAPARVLAGWVLSLETSAAIPALQLVASDARFEDELRHDALLAIGELGGPDDAESLITRFATYQSRDKRLAAACLIAIHALGGDAAAERALSNADPRSTRSVLTTLKRGSRRDRERSTHRLARALVPLLDEQAAAEGRSQP